MKKKILIVLCIIFFYQDMILSQEISVLENILFNGPEAIIYDSDLNRYIVGNANNGKMLVIDEYNNTEVFINNIGANVLMDFLMIGDSLFVTTNEPPALFCLNKNTGDEIYSVNLDAVANACSRMVYDSREDLIYIAEQYGKILKVNIKSHDFNVFAEANIPQGSQSLAIDTCVNRLILFSWGSSYTKFINLYDSLDVTFGYATGSYQYTASFKNTDGYIYASSWNGSKIMKLHIDTLENHSIFCDEYLNNPTGITYNPEAETFAVCNYGNNTVTLIPDSYSTVSLKETKNDELILLSPNICIDKIHVIINKKISFPLIIEIFDMKGNIVNEQICESMNFEVDITDLSAGSYIIKFKNKDINITEKIIKK